MHYSAVLPKYGKHHFNGNKHLNASVFDRSNRSQRFFKIDALKKFAVIKFQALNHSSFAI